MTPDALDPLFVNHLAFLAAHRGTVCLRDGYIEVDSPFAGFSSVTPMDDDTVLPADCETVRLVPASGPSWHDRLSSAGFAPAEALSYRSLGAIQSSRHPSADAEIHRAGTDDDAVAFADVQYRAFIDPQEADAAEWGARFELMAHRNVCRANQDFLIAKVDAKPAAAALVVHAGGVSGLYAVATRPDYQRRGLSSLLLREAFERARAQGRELILQTAKGSYAEGFYERLGFTEAFVSQVWRLRN